MALDLNEWLEDEKRKLKRKYNFREGIAVHHRYSHFDPRLSPDQMMDVLNDTKKIAQHSFLPFLRFHEAFRKFAPPDVNHPDGFWKEKLRPISYASHSDSYIFSWYDRQLSEKYEKEVTSRNIANCVLAYRRSDERHKKSTIHSSNEVFKNILERGECTALTFDIEKFFETLDHKLLFRLWKKLLGVDQLSPDHQAVFNSVTRFSYLELKAVINALGLKSGKLPSCLSDEPGLSGVLKNHVHKNVRIGIPQGCAMSGTLSNLYMIGCDEVMHAACIAHNALYRRYSDDIIIICDNKDGDYLQSLLQSQIEKHKLQMNSSKIHRHEFVLQKGQLSSVSKSRAGNNAGIPLQYLGFTFDGQFSQIRDSSVSRFCASMEEGINAEVSYQLSRLRFFRTKNENQKFIPQLRKHRLYVRYSDLSEKINHRNFLTYMYTSHKIMEGISKIDKQKFNLNKKLERKIRVAQEKLNHLIKN